VYEFSILAPWPFICAGLTLLHRTADATGEADQSI